MATLKEQFLGNAAGCAEISPMSEFAEGSFTSYWNFPELCFAVICSGCAVARAEDLGWPLVS